MSREIKFRIWDVKKRRWFGDTIFEEPPQLDSDFSLSLNDSLFLVNQYTGLKDKNGKEAYEGDIIVNRDGDKRQILYSWAGFEMRLLNGERDSNNTTWYFDFEVVGNIYEMAELVK